MEIQEKHGINFQLNSKDFTASIVESPKASGIVAIPRLFRFNKKNYKVTTIKRNAFHNNTIESIAFANNSEVIKFEDDAFEKSSITKLQIPPKLRFIESRSFFLLKDLTEFDVSPNNHLFTCYNNELLIGKSDEKQDNFDILYLGRSDLKKVIIPSSIKIIKRYAFGESNNLKSIKFEKNSQIECIEGWVLCENLKKFEIPRKLKSTESDAFQYANSLTDLKVSPKNRVYSWINNTFLIRKNVYISFCRRDVSEVEIPRNIKEIDPFAFKKCENLTSINFEKDSMLEIINENSFENVIKPIEVIVPMSVKVVKKLAFSYMNNLKSIQFLSEEIEIENFCFYSSDNLINISFPNAKNIIFNDLIKESQKIYIRKDAKIEGHNIDENKKHIEIIKDLSEKTKYNNDDFNDNVNTNKLNSQSNAQIQNQPQSQIKNQTQIVSQNQTQIKNQNQHQIEDQNQHQIEDQNQHQIENQNQHQIENQNQHQIEDQNQHQIENQNQHQIENQNQHQIENQNQHQIEDQNQTQIKNQNQHQIEDQNQNQIENQIQPQSQIQNQNEELKLGKTQNDLNQETDNNSSKCCLLI